MRQALHIIKDDEPTKAEVFMAYIQQKWREHAGPSGKGWIPIRDEARKPLLVDEVLERSYRRTDGEL